jgi:hypothetical protein
MERDPMCVFPTPEGSRDSPCLCDDQVYGAIFNAGAFVLGWKDDGFASIGRAERANLRKVEQTFRIRLRFSHAAAQLREAGSNDGDWELLLCAAVQGGDKRCHLGLFNVLKFVDED